MLSRGKEGSVGVDRPDKEMGGTEKTPKTFSKNLPLEGKTGAHSKIIGDHPTNNEG